MTDPATLALAAGTYTALETRKKKPSVDIPTSRTVQPVAEQKPSPTRVKAELDAVERRTKKRKRSLATRISLGEPTLKTEKLGD